MDDEITGIQDKIMIFILSETNVLLPPSTIQRTPSLSLFDTYNDTLFPKSLKFFCTLALTQAYSMVLTRHHHNIVPFYLIFSSPKPKQPINNKKFFPYISTTVKIPLIRITLFMRWASHHHPMLDVCHFARFTPKLLQAVLQYGFFLLTTRNELPFLLFRVISFHCC